MTIILVALLIGCCLANSKASIICTQPEVPENGHVIFPTAGPLHVGTVVKYKCDIGFVHLGVEERTCQKDGSWSQHPPVCAVNVAMYKPASQSSTDQQMSANFSTDGVLEGKCSRTKPENNAWWQVDLLENYSVYAVELFIQDFGSAEENGGESALEIRIGPHPTTSSLENSLCFRHKGTLEKEQLHTFVCGSQLNGRYVAILGRNRQLHLCEVFVLSTSSASSWQCGTLPNMDSWGVFHSRCYHNSREALPWFSANTHCRMSGASLPIHVSKTEQAFLSSQLESRSPSDAQFYWIGLVSSPQDGAWRWTDGTVATGSEVQWADPSAQEVSVSSPGSAYSVTLANPFAWRWIPALQALWYHWICHSKPLFCSSPGVPASGGVMLSTQTYGIGTNAYYYCNYGFALQGSETRTCQENGTWSWRPPNCLAINCGTPDTVMNGYVRLLNGTTEFGSLSEYRCQLGFRITGRALRVCHADGSWSGQAPTCAEIDCGYPEEIGNGTMVLAGNGTLMGSVAEYACNSGFRIVGSAVRHCSEAATWTPAAPTCYDAASLRHVLVEETNPTPHHWQHQTNLMTGFIVAVVILLVLIFLVIFWMWKKKQLYDTFSLSTVYATPTTGSSSGNKDLLYAYTNASMSTDDATTYYSAVPLGDQLLLSVSQSEEDNSSSNDRRLSILSASDLYYAASNLHREDVEPTDQNPPQQAAASLGSRDTPENFQLELPPQMLKLQQLPNGNIHLTLPCFRQAPSRSRPAMPFRTNSVKTAHGESSVKTGTLPRLPRRQPRQKKFNTMVGYMRKKISETTATLKVTRPERRKRPRIPTSSAPAANRLTISSPISRDTRLESEKGRTSPTPTEILFSFDYDGDEMEEADSVLDGDKCDSLESSSDSSGDKPDSSHQPIYDFPPENSRKLPLRPPQTSENGYLKSRSASVRREEDNENRAESNIYEEVRARQVLTLESSGFELAHTYC